MQRTAQFRLHRLAQDNRLTYVLSVTKENVRVFLFPLPLRNSIANSVLDLLPQVLPYLNIASGIALEKPNVPLAGYRPRVTLAESYALAFVLGTNEGNASFSGSYEICRELLYDMGLRTCRD